MTLRRFYFARVVLDASVVGRVRRSHLTFFEELGLQECENGAAGRLKRDDKSALLARLGIAHVRGVASAVLTDYSQLLPAWVYCDDACDDAVYLAPLATEWHYGVTCPH